MKIKKNMTKNIHFVNQYDIDLNNLLNKNNSRNMMETVHIYLSYEVLLHSQSASIIIGISIIVNYFRIKSHNM